MASTSPVTTRPTVGSTAAPTRRSTPTPSRTTPGGTNRATAVGPGTFGENLTTEGIDISAALVGERWRVGTCVLEVVQPRQPCFKLGIRMGSAAFKDRFAAAERPGTYLRIVEEGDIGAGDPIEVVDRPDHSLTVVDLLRG